MFRVAYLKIVQTISVYPKSKALLSEREKNFKAMRRSFKFSHSTKAHSANGRVKVRPSQQRGDSITTKRWLMRIDAYTKIILTIIAISLVIIAIRLTPIVEASRSEPTTVNIVEIGGQRVYKTIPVVMSK